MNAVVTPLQGFRIIDLTNVLAGPFCCQQLAHLGAEVIKVEKPDGGDLARQLGADAVRCRENMGASFLSQNAGKQSIILNLKDPADHDRLLALVAEADALVENFRPGVMARLGLDHKLLRAHNPKLVYCAISGFGQTGPLADAPAYDQIIQGMSGLMSITGDQLSAPLRAGHPVADTVGGMTAAFAVCSALAAPRGSRGCYIDVSMLESMLSSMGWITSDYLIAGHEPEPVGNNNATGAPSGTFRTGSGLLNIAAAQQPNFEKLCGVLDRKQWIAERRFADRHSRLQHRDTLTTLIEEVLQQQSADEWQALICGEGVPAGCVFSVEEILDHPQLDQRALIHAFEASAFIGDTVSVCCPGFLINGQRPTVSEPPPWLGQHNALYNIPLPHSRQDDN